jgi:hypothetical protein
MYIVDPDKRVPNRSRVINQSTLTYYKDIVLTKQINYLCNQIHEAETSKICGTHVKDEKCIKRL